ncbi:protein SAWADEE HOMEODOMAIN HOMOLOG 1-like [Andrographis paniculata]|uniref:protein SAWADEE HOMEODOMAIN HOMOLOG 1-like n=1 Tax=Andrographis paniculata TaxID=175694 RepID=UPI0021E7C80D|nr:protein SAWADEE HOMEODOMAIN HOMOLOG 1-like [Andrographis paniculata]
MNLRSKREPFMGFTNAEVQKMEQMLNESKVRLLDVDFYKELARRFNRSSSRAGKPRLKWTEIQSWFQTNQQSCSSRGPLFDAAEKSHLAPGALSQKETTGNPKMPEDGKNQNMLKKLEFEARSSQDGAWYDVDAFLSHRVLSSGETEVYVRYLGFGAEEDEWVNVKTDVRERSVALEHYECQKVKVGDQILCFQERQDQARYYDAHVIEIRRRLHDIRGCRCLFLIKYDHDNTQDRVPLTRLCCRPSMLSEDRVASN